MKYFTQSCGYCRKLKHVTEALLEERKWSFEMYDVDCSENDDLCATKAPFVDSYPYVVIYNLDGGMEASLNGYYPYETMKEAFLNIEKLQEKALEKKGIKTESPTAPTPKHPNTDKTHTTPSKETTKSVAGPDSHEIVPVASHEGQAKAKTHDNPSSHSETKHKKEEETSSWRERLKIGIILLGVWLWDKMVAPYLKSSAHSMDKSRVIEIPVGSKDASWAKKDDEADNLLNDKL